MKECTDNMIRRLKQKIDSPFTDEDTRIEILEWFNDLISLKFLDGYNVIKKMDKFKKKGMELSK